MNPIEKTFVLDPSACDEVAEQITAFGESLKLERKDILRYRLAAEECLLFWMARDGEGAPVQLRMGQRMLTPYISLEMEGEPMDPYRDESGEFGPFCGGIMQNLHLTPEYSYDGGRNRIYFRVQRKRLGQMGTLGIVIAASALFGVLGLMILPETARLTIQQGIVVPIYDTFFNLLRCIAGPMIFLSVAWGIYGIGDAATLGRVGKRLMLSYIGVVFLASACSSVLFPLFRMPLTHAGTHATQLSSLAELILGIFPSTIVEPFATGNTLQIIFLAAVIGIAMLFLGRKTSSVARAIEQVNYLVQFLMEFISRLVPYVIFLVILNLIWSGDLGVLSSVWQMFAIMAVAFVIAAAVFLVYTGLRQKVSPFLLLQKGFPTFLVALATASSAAAFSSHMSACEKKYGISNSLSSFGIPLGMVLHKPIPAIYFVILVFYFASKYSIAVSVTWIITAVFIAAIVAIAMPPIPGGGAVAYTVLFAQIGIPAEALSVALAIDILTDFLITAFDMFVLPLTLINVSSRLSMIDREILRARK